MTIKEIARLAGVSVSTVSKIMNHKDDSISAKTREHVLRIAKEYNYTPYASVITPRTKTPVVGVLLRDLRHAHSPACSRQPIKTAIRSCSAKAVIPQIQS